MRNPIAELTGDEMTRVLWEKIKQQLILPYVDLKTEVYDLGLSHRDETDDAVTRDAAAAIKRRKVGVKCATITPNEARMREYGLKKLWKSPNGTIRAALDGTVFRTPILSAAAKIGVTAWKKPITIARHAFGDLYQAAEYRTQSEGTAELVFTDASGGVHREGGVRLPRDSVVQMQFNTKASVVAFAEACFRYALSVKQDLWFSAKDTIAKQYDGLFREEFDRCRERYQEAFEQAGIRYRYALIDSAVAAAIRSEGGFVWACKNYDGDVLSDLIAAAYGSIAMMSSVLVSPDGCFEYEAAHGTVQDQYYRYLKGERTSVNPIATIWAWTGALRKRGEYDELSELCAFADRLETACLAAIRGGVMTDDLAAVNGVQGVDTDTFLRAIAAEMK